MSRAYALACLATIALSVLASYIWPYWIQP